MRLFVAQGYLVRRGIEIYTDQFLNRATDLDVLALRFISPFRHYVQIAECKSGSNRPLDRIFWLAGARNFSDADTATFVRDNTSWDIKDFARRNSVELLDKRCIEELEGRLRIDAGYWPALTDRGFLQKNLSDWNRSLKAEADISALYIFMLGEFRWAREVASIRYIIFMMRRITRLHLKDSEASIWRMLLVECFTQIIIFYLYFAGRTLGLTSTDIEALARKDMKYGTLDPSVVERMMRYAKKLSEQVLESVGVSGKRIDEADFDYPEPADSEQVLRMYASIADNPRDAGALPAFVDYVLTERFVKGTLAVPWIDRTLSGANLGRVVHTAASLCRVLQSIDAVPPAFVSVFVGAKTPDGTNPQSSTRISPLIADADEPKRGGRKVAQGTPDAENGPPGAASERDEAVQAAEVGSNDWGTSLDQWTPDKEPPRLFEH